MTATFDPIVYIDTAVTTTQAYFGIPCQHQNNLPLRRT